MTTRTVNWCTAEQLNCAVSATTVGYLCVNSTILADPPATTKGIVSAFITGVRDSTCYDLCGLCKYVYTITYDDAQLVAGFALAPADIQAVYCDDCLEAFIQKIIGGI